MFNRTNLQLSAFMSKLFIFMHFHKVGVNIFPTAHILFFFTKLQKSKFKAVDLACKFLNSNNYPCSCSCISCFKSFLSPSLHWCISWNIAFLSSSTVVSRTSLVFCFTCFIFLALQIAKQFVFICFVSYPPNIKYSFESIKNVFGRNL